MSRQVKKGHKSGEIGELGRGRAFIDLVSGCSEIMVEVFHIVILIDKVTDAFGDRHREEGSGAEEFDAVDLIEMDHEFRSTFLERAVRIEDREVLAVLFFRAEFTDEVLRFVKSNFRELIPGLILSWVEEIEVALTGFLIEFAPVRLADELGSIRVIDTEVAPLLVLVIIIHSVFRHRDPF